VLLWHRSVQDVPGGDAFPSALIASGDRAIVGGSAQDVTGRYAWTLRALDIATGAVAWEERIANGGVNGLASVGTRVFAAGTLNNIGGVADLTVRAYDVLSGGR
jgi:outer membrane protein assembly factor BamB